MKKKKGNRQRFLVLTFHVEFEDEAHLVPGVDLALVEPGVLGQDRVYDQLPGVWLALGVTDAHAPV